MDYFVITVPVADAAIIDGLPDGAPDAWRFHEGEPLAGEFPKGASVPFSKHFSGQRALKDFQPNTLGVLIVSPRTRAALEGLQPGNVEFLPMDLRDHSGAVVGPGYAVLNVLGTVEAIDLERSKLVMDNLIPGDINEVKRLVLDRKAIPPEALIFRCAHRSRIVLVREDVRDALVKAGLAGCRLDPAEGWREN